MELTRIKTNNFKRWVESSSNICGNSVIFFIYIYIYRYVYRQRSLIRCFVWDFTRSYRLHGVHESYVDGSMGVVRWSLIYVIRDPVHPWWLIMALDWDHFSKGFSLLPDGVDASADIALPSEAIRPIPTPPPFRSPKGVNKYVFGQLPQSCVSPVFYFFSTTSGGPTIGHFSKKNRACGAIFSTDQKVESGHASEIN